MTAIAALQRAIHARLTGDAELVSLLGGAHVYDRAPRGTKPPYVVFADESTMDYASAGSDGEEIGLDLEIWSSADGRREAAAIAAALRRALSAEMALEPPFLLANLEIPETRFGAVSDKGLTRGVMRIRAVTATG